MKIILSADRRVTTDVLTARVGLLDLKRLVKGRVWVGHQNTCLLSSLVSLQNLASEVEASSSSSRDREARVMMLTPNPRLAPQNWPGQCWGAADCPIVAKCVSESWTGGHCADS